MRKDNPDRKGIEAARRLRCAIYTRKSTEEGLEQEFNSLDAQREAAEAFILSQRRGGGLPCPLATTMVALPRGSSGGIPQRSANANDQLRLA